MSDREAGAPGDGPADSEKDGPADSGSDGPADSGDDGPADSGSDRPTGSESDQRESRPTSAFEALGHDIRLRIVESLAETRRDNWQWRGKRFAELRKDVGVRDAGKFSYHLERLQPAFVVKEGEEYVLTSAGMRVAGAVTAEAYDGQRERREAELDVECQICGDPLTARYGYEYCRWVCETHGELYGNTLPPGAADDRPTDELIALADREAVRDVQRARDGACPHCWGPVEASLPAAEVMPDPETGEQPDDWESVFGEAATEMTLAQFSCERCGLRFWVPPGFCVLEHPAVVGFCYDHDVDLREAPTVAQQFIYSGVGELVSEDPVRYRIDVEFGDDRLRVWLDDETTVVETERD